MNGRAAPHFGRKAEFWLRCQLRSAFFTLCDNGDFVFVTDGAPWTPAVVDALLDWYLTDPMRYVLWVPAAEYRGRGFSNGAWSFLSTRARADLSAAVGAIDRGLDDERCATLDDWLRLDRAGELWYAGAPSGMRLVPAEMRARRTAPVVTCPCGASFTSRRRHPKRCPDCLAIAKAERHATYLRLKAEREAVEEVR